MYHKKTWNSVLTRIKENIKTLGLKWNPKDDTFGFAVTTSVTTSKCTKRTVLSEISRLFDPLCVLGLVIVKAKIFRQRLAAQNGLGLAFATR
ncbi:hypothetical protein AVEN_255296-1 [Araneus ventricosus]|uniref:Reverse transcriptase domain-containing protein n=1 Tax=Araneus ventricosus TaxID=182803 RepID=A0A4Y2BBM9_ARAVE|nr:hypothetical protein AVEN_255296-1 [Araneus ventricosus]